MHPDGDAYLGVLRDGGTFRLPADRQSWTEGELLYQYRLLWLLFYRECATFKRDLERFYGRSYTPARRFYSDHDALRATGIDPDAAHLGTRVDLVDLRDLHFYRLDFEPNPVPPAALSRYFEELDRFCQRWGLDRLYPIGTAWRARRESDPEKREAVFASSQPDGPAEVHLWCEAEAMDFGYFGLVSGWTGFLPTIGDPVYFKVDGPDGNQVIVRDATGDPTIQLTAIEDSWHPMRESRKAARARILQRAAEQLDCELERIQARGEGAGLMTVRNAPALMRDAAFACIRLALDMTYLEIEQLAKQLAGKSLDPEEISDAVYDRAPLLGLRLR